MTSTSWSWILYMSNWLSAEYVVLSYISTNLEEILLMQQHLVFSEASSSTSWACPFILLSLLQQSWAHQSDNWFQLAWKNRSVYSQIPNLTLTYMFVDFRLYNFSDDAILGLMASTGFTASSSVPPSFCDWSCEIVYYLTNLLSCFLRMRLKMF